MHKMINIKKVANYVRIAGKKSVVQTVPIKSSFEGLKLASLQKDVLDFEMKPKKYSSQSEKLKDFYESKGRSYLLPHEE